MRRTVRPYIELCPAFCIIGNQIGLHLALFILTIQHGIHARDGAVCGELCGKAVRNVELLRYRQLRFHIGEDAVHAIRVEIAVCELHRLMMKDILNLPGQLTMIWNRRIHDARSEKERDHDEKSDAGTTIRCSKAPVPQNQLYDDTDEQQRDERQESLQMRTHTAPLTELPERVEAQRI